MIKKTRSIKITEDAYFRLKDVSEVTGIRMQRLVELLATERVLNDLKKLLKNNS